jgi:plastocyanin
LGGFLFFMNRGETPIEVEVDLDMPVPGSSVEEMIVEEENVKEFTINAAPYSFTPNIMSVNLGDTVKITVKNTKGTHDLKIDEFDVATRVLSIGEEQTITFVADKSGSFEYYCSVGNHRAMGMVGTLTVR